jgi:hypothetical protein
LRKLAEGNGIISDYLETKELLTDQIEHWSIEYSTLVNRNLTIVSSSNNYRWGETFDPSGVASKALDLNARIMVSVVMSYDEFMKEGSPRFL